MGLEEFRQRIDEVDVAILDVVSKRMAIITELAEYKKIHKIPIIDSKRDEEVLKDRISKAKELDSEFVEKLIKVIVDESKRIQRQIF